MTEDNVIPLRPRPRPRPARDTGTQQPTDEDKALFAALAALVEADARRQRPDTPA